MIHELADAIVYGHRTDDEHEVLWVPIPVKKYRGSVLVIYGTEDKIVPDEIKHSYEEAVKGKGFYHNMRGGGHLLFSSKTPKEEKIKKDTIKILLGFLTEVTSE